MRIKRANQISQPEALRVQRYHRSVDVISPVYRMKGAQFGVACSPDVRALADNGRRCSSDSPG